MINLKEHEKHPEPKTPAEIRAEIERLGLLSSDHSIGTYEYEDKQSKIEALKWALGEA